MTNKEAIAILTHNWKYRELIDNGYQYEALNLAIKALKLIERIKFNVYTVNELINELEKEGKEND